MKGEVMKEKEINWDKIPLSHDALFGQVMREPNLCKTMLEKLLGFSIEKISYPEPQKTFDVSLRSKGIRMDIYVKDGDGTKVYTVEMQTRNQGVLGKRVRYYIGIADTTLLQKGETYDKLPIHYVIFICTFDPFGKGRYRYTFENVCKEDPSISLEDGIYTLFFNTKGVLDDVADDVKAFLHYFEGILSDDPYVKQLDEEVQKVKQDKDWREYYMTLDQMMREEQIYWHRQGVEEGRLEGRLEGKLESAKEFILQGSSYEFVSQVLGIPEEKIREYMEECAKVSF